MKIQYMSDLHLEFRENSRYLKHNELPVTGDVLVLAGDIFYLRDRIAPMMKFWKWASDNYRQVLIVPGNHEYYNYSDVMERGLQWKWMFRENVGFYQNQVIRIDDTDFVLSTLWSRINPNDEYFVWKGMNDFRQIKFDGKLLQVEEFNRMHETCIDFIRKSVEESTAGHIVVVTHHLPMQNFENIWLRISSLVISPVMVPRWWMTWRMSSLKRSAERSSSRAVRARCRASRAWRRASRWRLFEMTGSPS